MAVVLFDQSRLSWDGLMCFVTYGKRGRWGCMNWIVLRWMRESSGRWERQLQQLTGAFTEVFSTFHCILLSPPSFHFLFRSLSFNLALSFFPLSFLLCYPASLSLPPPLLSLPLHYWYRTHLWIFPVPRDLMTSPLSLLSQSLSLSLVYLAAQSLFLPLRLACWWS